MSLCKGIDTEDSNSNYPLIYGIALPIFTLRVEATFLPQLVEIVWRTREHRAKSKTVR